MGDAASIGISYFLEKKSKKQPDKIYTYGYLRYSVMGSVITTLILLVGSILVVINAVNRILNPQEINYNGMIIFAIIGVVVNFILGALMMVGVGLYAPCMALCLLLGLSADMAFPIMMGSCAFLMPPGSIPFIKAGKYHRAAALPLIISGSIGVLIACFVITSLPLTLLTWVVVGVMFICAFNFYKDAKKGK